MMMNKHDIVAMAREAGLFVPQAGIPENGALMRFTALVAAAEREACAKVCDFEVARLTAIDELRPALAVGICAAAIRARKENT